MRGWTLLLGLLCLGCKSEPPPPPAAAKPKPAKPASSASAWKEIATPVPRGKQLPCAKLLPPETLSSRLARTVDLVEESARDPDATAICRIVAVDKKGKQGDEVCRASIFCGSAWDVADLKKRCDARGDQSTLSDVGLHTCVQKVPAGDKERHLITALDADTRCKVVINAAPNQFDLAYTRACASAVVDTLDKAGLAP
jgi:hypothetical protein